MREDAELSAAILKIIADNESYPARITAEDIKNNNAMKESFKDKSSDVIVFHIKMLEESDLIDVKFHDSKTFSSTIRIAYIRGLTKQGKRLC